jgi:hypothetical protein
METLFEWRNDLWCALQIAQDFTEDGKRKRRWVILNKEMLEYLCGMIFAKFKFTVADVVELYGIKQQNNNTTIKDNNHDKTE